VNSIVQNAAGEIVLIRRTDHGNWSLPGGAVDLGESLGHAAIKETLEETGITRLTGVSGLYPDPRHVLEYPSNGEVGQELSIVFTAEAIDGEPTPSSESSHVEWIAVDDLASLPMHASMRKRIDHYLADPPSLYWD